MGVDIAKAALAAGHKVIATGRNTDKVTQAVGESADLLVVKLDVTDLSDAESAVKAAVEQFGRIDVLVNNAGNFYAGFFEEITPEDFRAQVETNQGAHPARESGRAAAALGRRSRRRRDFRTEGQRPARPGRRLPRAVLVARARRHERLASYFTK
jgi:NAD(P)-dependent dehydrogenase (short-subunit alcohol dehydrogenase family)